MLAKPLYVLTCRDHFRSSPTLLYLNGNGFRPTVPQVGEVFPLQRGADSPGSPIATPDFATKKRHGHILAALSLGINQPYRTQVGFSRCRGGDFDAGGEGGKVALLEFEEVRQEYAVQDARGIPMSVRERYEKALAEMRFRIREARNGRTGKKLGELLVEQGVLDQEMLQQGLAEQRERRNGELLGEVLLGLGLIKEEVLLSALHTQASERELRLSEAE